MSRISLVKEPVVFARVSGLNGRTRELRAIVSTGARYCSIPLMDAYHLGYMKAITYSSVTGEVEADRPEMAATMSNVIQAPLVVLDRVSIGDLVAEEVEALAFHPPEPAAIEMVIGMTFLKNFRLTYEPKNMEFTLEDHDSLWS